MADTTSIADYQVILDKSVTLGPDSTEGTERSGSFTVPGDMIHSGFSRSPILAFKVIPLEDSTLTIFINDREIMSANFSKSHTRIFWEVFSFDTAFPNGASFANPAPVRFLVLNGELNIGDAVIWYQVDQPWE